MSGGVGAALEQVLDGEDGAEALAQSGLFDDLDVSETGALDTASPLTKAHPLADALGKRKGGRPAGSKNRRTEATVRFLLSQGRHPVQAMMELYAMTPVELARRIGIGEVTDDVLLDLLKLQTRMMEAVAPYVAQRLPQAVQIDAAGHLTIGFSGVSLPARGGSAGVSGGGQVVEGQAMAVTLPVKSDASGRTDGQAIDHEQETP